MWRTDSRDSDATTEDWTPPAIAPGKVSLTQRIFRRAWGAPTADPAAAVEGTAGSTGAPLPDAARAKFEGSLGADLSSVRVHTGGASAAAAEGLGARAFATGQDIHFGAGQYRPDDPFGMHLLAHEVAHTVQQGSAAAGPQPKLAVSEPGDALEREADHAADAMLTGAPATITTGAAPRLAREDAAAPAQAAPAPVFVEFTKEGTWTGADVIAKLSTLGPVPEDLKAAILAGPIATAKYCVALRDRIAPPDETIANALTSRVNELVHATSRSPLLYQQLADVARWSAEFPAVAGAAPADPAAADAKPAAPAAAADGNAAALTYATKLAAQPGARVRAGDKDVIRTKDDTKNDTHPGEESGNAALTGWRFIHDPFANTVIAVRPDGTGIQYTYQIEKAGDDGVPTATLVNTEEMSALRVGVAKRQELSAPQREQESATGPATRKAGDEKQGREARAKFRAENPGVVEKWEADVQAWVDGGKKGARPPVPRNGKGVPYQEGDHKTTACVTTPTEMFRAGGGKSNAVIPFTPPTDWKSWRTIATHPEGPKIGDVYYLYDLVAKQGAHMGVVKSRTPVSGQDDYETWVVTDGGQGGYEQIQLEQERTRGPYNKQTGIFMSSIAEAGQAKGERKLTGWVDIDAFHAENPPTVHV